MAFRDIWSHDWIVAQHKSIEAQIYFWPNQIIGLEIGYRGKTYDHKGCELEVALLGLHFRVNYYDHRHREDYDDA